MPALNHVADAVVRKLVPVSIRYNAARNKFFRAHPQSNGQDFGADKTVVEAIKREGIYIWPDFIPRGQALALGEKALPLLREVQKGQTFKTQTLNDKDAGLFRIKEADTVIPESKPVFDDPRLMPIAKAVTTPNVRAHMRMIELREGIYSHCSEDCWHFDEPFKYKFKVFLLLSDVTEDNSPFAYVKRSNLAGPWRTAKERDAFHNGYDGNWGFFHQHEYEAVMKRYGKPLGWEPVICTGKAGTMILFDANGLHRREILRSGFRVIMSNYYQA
ncbi:MAG TPA: hypothetical protein VJQ55_06375 [Candidatus Binatia bacterium]|nr:hypothetical protein [Candidatus Binatia bacterium]